MKNREMNFMKWIDGRLAITETFDADYQEIHGPALTRTRVLATHDHAITD